MEKSKLGSQMDLELADEYLSSLIDLQYNSKPLIDMLTILAEENITHGQVIVDAVEQHISKVNFCSIFTTTQIYQKDPFLKKKT